MVSNKTAMACGLSALLLVPIAAGHEIHRSKVERVIEQESARLVQRHSVLQDIRHGLSVGGNSQVAGQEVVVNNKGDYVAIYGRGWNPQQLRVYGLSREQANTYLESQEHRYSAQQGQLRRVRRF